MDDISVDRLRTTAPFVAGLRLKERKVGVYELRQD